MLKSYYRSSVTALVAGVVVFGASVFLTRALGVSQDVVFAPGLAILALLNALGADLPSRVAVLGTLLAWCLAADVVLLFVNRPWREEAGEGRAE